MRVPSNLDDDEADALSTLAEAGLIPQLRPGSKVGSSGYGRTVEGLRRRLEAIGKDAGLDRVGFAGTGRISRGRVVDAAAPRKRHVGRARFHLQRPGDRHHSQVELSVGSDTGRRGPRHIFRRRGHPTPTLRTDEAKRPGVEGGRRRRVRAPPVAHSRPSPTTSVRRVTGPRSSCDDSRLVDRAAAVRAGARLVGQEHDGPDPGNWALGRHRVGHHRRRTGARWAAGSRLRSMLGLSTGLSDGGFGGTRGARCRAMPRCLGATAGADPVRVPDCDGRPSLRL